MSSHKCQFKVLKESVWGMIHVHAVLKCDGVVDKKPCPVRAVKVLDIEDLEKIGDKRPKYFWRGVP